MRKQELVHLHALGVQLRREVADRRSPPPSTYAAYEDLRVEPTSIHRRKDAHREAILALFDGVATACRTADAPADPAPPATGNGGD